uniref:Phyllospetin-H3 n=1 Tax=Pithecopus hypochondrialis TaxID=317381 RepID=PLS3_PITHY|nr:RecName: Full=Phyllospetin-H3; Short=PLS-H3; AltName: Full=Phylloseptin-3; Short=PS-3 [Pithecopus hypochondrialis]
FLSLIPHAINAVSALANHG